MPKAADYVTPCAATIAIGLALAALASPAAAELRIVEGVLTHAQAGAGGAAFNFCNYPPGVRPTGYESPAMPCDTRGTLIGTMFVTFLPSQRVIEVPQPENIYVFAGCTGDGSPYAETCQDSGGFSFGGVPQPPPPGTPKLSDEQKKRYAHWSNYFAMTAGTMALATGVFVAIPNPPAATALGAMSAMMYILSARLNEDALDPIDNNYTTIAPFIPYPFPAADLALKPCMVSSGSTGGGPAQWIANNIGLAEAISTSFNRMQGAIAAGDAYWTAQQGQAMLGYAATLDTRLDTHPMSTIFACQNPQPITSAAAVLAWERSIQANGMSPLVKNSFASLGITDPFDVKQAAGLLYTQDPELVADAYNAILGPFGTKAFYWTVLDGNVP